MNPILKLAAALLISLPAAGPAFAQAGGEAGGAAGGIATAAAGVIVVNRAYLVGLWTDDEDCADAVLFDADGRFTAADGAEGVWELDGDALTLTGRATLTVTIVPIDEDTIETVNPDGSHGRSIRCEGEEPDYNPNFVAAGIA